MVAREVEVAMAVRMEVAEAMEDPTEVAAATVGRMEVEW